MFGTEGGGSTEHEKNKQRARNLLGMYVKGPFDLSLVKKLPVRILEEKGGQVKCGQSPVKTGTGVLLKSENRKTARRGGEKLGDYENSTNSVLRIIKSTPAA